MTGFLTLELRRSVRDVRNLVIAVAMPIWLYLLLPACSARTASAPRDCPSRRS
jgi:hypothetical protein